MDLWNSLFGQVTVELTSAAPGDLLQVITHRGITVLQVEWISDLTLRCDIRRKDLKTLGNITEKRGDTLKLRGKRGLYWAFHTLIKRPVLTAGICILLALILFLPTRVLFLRVEGNEHIPSERILEAAEESGIRFWASRRAVRSEKVKNSLLGALPELQWAGVNTKGCLAVISVRERTVTGEEVKQNQVCSIVAAKDGIVESCTATEGNLLCREGQAVKAGEVLISGFTDCGICIRASAASGEIYARTRGEITVTTLSQWDVKGATTGQKQKFSLLIGKKRINLWKDSGIWEGSCDRMYEEYYITLPGGFVLPVALIRETYVYRETETRSLDTYVLQNAMIEAGRSYLKAQMAAGQILNGKESFSFEEDTCSMNGVYLCREMIGRVQMEKIGE